MNVLSVFEQRVGTLFTEKDAGVPPLPFKKLGKKSVREMESETFVIDGVDTAPALYTILVSTEDDQAMRPLYVDIADELSSLIEAQAKKRSYSFVGKPLARFMVDPSLKHGKFAVFAENIDARTLARLRDEENQFLGIAVPQPVVYPAYDAAPTGGAQPTDDADAGLDIIPEDAADLVEEPLAAEVPEVVPAAAEPEPVAEVPAPEAEPEPAPAEPAVEAEAEQVPEVAPEPEAPAVQVPEVAPEAEPAPEPVAAPAASWDVDGQGATPVPEAPAAEPEPAPQVQEAATPDFLKAASAAVADAPMAVAPEAPVVPAAPAVAEAPAAPAAPAPKPAHAAPQSAHMASTPEEPTTPATCLLTDQASGRQYVVTRPKVLIGRERTPGGVVLHDPNVSRRHAELAHNGTSWTITDLHSTNGTLVNDIDVDQCSLRDGDVITVGLINLSFKEG
jgi:hypothetical protein